MRPDQGTPIEDEHPEQDPAEGSRDVVEKDLAKQDEQDGEPEKGEAGRQKDEVSPS